jgi:hypothetical protein
MKRILSFLSIFMLLLLTSITVGASNKLNTLVVNYYRYFDHDALHTAWIWQYAPNGGDGVKDHEFQKSTDPESRWLTLEVDLKNDTRYQGSTAVGIIIKRGTGWSGAREPGGDRIIDLSKVSVSNGVGNVYFVQEDVNIYYSISEADTSDKVLDAAFDANNKINIYATLPPTKTLVYSNGVKVQEFGAQTTYHYTITLDQFDINKQYKTSYS